MAEQWITSVGIDLGTSTTKLIVSRLRLGRTSSSFSLPRYQIVERQLLYASPIYATPLKQFDEIDAAAVSRIIQQEYEKAKIRLSDIQSGAVIITGETATKKNAEQIVHFLAERAGDFVVATAGADLEAVLAGKGSGAEARSMQMKGVIANVDVGGGTANVAFFQRGKIIGTVTFHIGGRLLRLAANGEIQYVSPHIQSWLKEKGKQIAETQQITYAKLQHIAREMARSLFDYLSGIEKDSSHRLLLAGAAFDKVPAIDEVIISGGIGRLMEEPYPQTIEEVSVYGDFGPLLAHGLKEVCRLYPFQTIPAEQTVRATVIGAGMQSTEISGSTVFINPKRLPLRNLPIVKLELHPEDLQSADSLRKKITAVMELGGKLFDSKAAHPFGIVLTGFDYCSYSSLQLLAGELAAGYKRGFPASNLLVVISENDMAKALGQSLSIRCQGKPDVICIDQIRVEHGDYIDLGEPISDAMIPVVIKTLAFQD